MLWKDRLFGPSASVTAAAAIIGVAGIASRLLGMLRDRILAGQFGAGADLDSYYAAFRVPDLLFNLLVVGALSAGFIPLFTQRLRAAGASGRLTATPEAWRLFTDALNFLLVALVVVAGLAILLAPWYVPLITPGFAPPQRETTVQLTRILALSPILLGVSGLVGSVLQSFRRFLVYSLSPVLYNVGIIVGALAFVPRWGIDGLAWGVVLGALLHLLVQLPLLAHLGFRYRTSFRPADATLRRMLRLTLDRTFALGITQINLLITTTIASTLAAGSIAVVTFANNLQSVPLGLFGLSYAIAAFPVLAAVRHDRGRYAASLSQTMRQILFFIIPASVLMVVLREQIVRAVLGSGQFDWEDTRRTVEALGWFSASLFAQSLAPLLARACFAREDSRTPLLASIVSEAVNLGAVLLLVRPLGVTGLTLAFSVASVVHCMLLWLALRRQVGDLDEPAVWRSLWRVLVASGVTAACAAGVVKVISPLVGEETWAGVALAGGSAALAGVVAYGAVSLALGTPEALSLWAALRRRGAVTISEPIPEAE